MVKDREPDNSMNATDPPDNQRNEEVSLESSGDEAKKIDPPDNQ